MVIEGMTEFLVALHSLPEELVEEAGNLVLDIADKAADEIRAAYPVKTGNLRRGVKVETVNAGLYGVAARVRSSAPHAWLYENGTATRQTATGANRGASGPHRVVVPIAIRHRKELYRQIARVLELHGATVTGL